MTFFDRNVEQPFRTCSVSSKLTHQLFKIWSASSGIFGGLKNKRAEFAHKGEERRRVS